MAAAMTRQVGFVEARELPLDRASTDRCQPPRLERADVRHTEGAEDSSRFGEDIARLVASRLDDVELPVEANIGGRAWSSLSGEGT